MIAIVTAVFSGIVSSRYLPLGFGILFAGIWISFCVFLVVFASKLTMKVSNRQFWFIRPCIIRFVIHVVVKYDPALWFPIPSRKSSRRIIVFDLNSSPLFKRHRPPRIKTPAKLWRHLERFGNKVFSLAVAHTEEVPQRTFDAGSVFVVPIYPYDHTPQIAG